MKFGKVENPESIDFTLPKDHLETTKLLQENITESLKIHVGCAKWNRQELKNFYPKGTKDELKYYATQFNSIELNAFFYRTFPAEQVIKWKEKVSSNFKFYPKIPQVISQYKRLKNVKDELNKYLDSIVHFEENLGMCFLQMPPNFTPKSFSDLQSFCKIWPEDIKLSVELRHSDWYSDDIVFNELSDLLLSNNLTHTITDTAGRRDLLHMRLTTPKCFIRYTGANHPSDYSRLNDWIERIKIWKQQGIGEVNFFIHQNLELESPLLAAYFNKKLNAEIGSNLIIPKTGNSNNQLELF
jgi:uncharacterized protein YecE (DUF72 family)